MKRWPKYILSVLVQTALLVVLPSVVWASGGDDYSENMFVPEFHVVAADLPMYAAGRLGVVPGSYWRIYQFLAYRALTGHALSKAETRKLPIDDWRGHLSDDWEVGTAGLDWLAARKAVPGAVEIKSDQPLVYAGTVAAFANCPDDALNYATRTLAERVARSPKWAAVWLEGQDAVFSNCGMPDGGYAAEAKKHLVAPAALPADAPAWLVFDRDYQHAAALFHFGDYAKARVRFQAIAAEAQSPWQGLSAYLAARCLLRQATLRDWGAPPLAEEDEAKDQAQRKHWLETAHAELVSLGKTDPAAARLVGWVDARLRPQARIEELAQVLRSGPIDDKALRALTDYLLIMDELGSSKLLQSHDDMTVWIATMQASAERERNPATSPGAEVQHKNALALVRKHWREKRETLWLLPLLANARPGELSESEFKAAAAVAPKSPGFQTVQYHLARLAILGGQYEQADRIVSMLLAGHKAEMSVATLNRWLHLKTITASNVDEFIAASLRGYADKNAPVPIPNESKSSTKPASSGRDRDFIIRLNRDFPLAELKALRLRKELQDVRKSLTELVWTRAIVLEDYATADELSDEMEMFRTATRHLYRRFKQAQGADAKRLAAAVILVNTPELGLNLLLENDHVSRGWGCRSNFAAIVLAQLGALDYVPSRALSEALRKQASEEQARLKAIHLRSEYLAPVLIDWARQRPADVEAPKALHFLVASTRLECGGQQPRGFEQKPKHQYSREAFQILHKLYPKSEWTAKTPYYY